MTTNTMRLSDGREIHEHYTPGMVKSWLTPRIDPNGVETFEPYNNLHPVRLAESFVIYADRTLARIKELEARLERHELANGGCVPKPAYDEIAEAYAELKFRMDGLEK